MDLSRKRSLELRIDTLVHAVDPDVRLLAVRAWKATKSNNYDLAASLVEKANDLYVPVVDILSYLVTYSSSARTPVEARRLVEGGKVSVNGLILRRLPYKVQPGDEVTVEGEDEATA